MLAWCAALFSTGPTFATATRSQTRLWCIHIVTCRHLAGVSQAPPAVLHMAVHFIFPSPVEACFRSLTHGSTYSPSGVFLSSGGFGSDMRGYRLTRFTVIDTVSMLERHSSWPALQFCICSQCSSGRYKIAHSCCQSLSLKLSTSDSTWPTSVRQPELPTIRLEISALGCKGSFADSIRLGKARLLQVLLCTRVKCGALS